jgi:hypothetical protein
MHRFPVLNVAKKQQEVVFERNEMVRLDKTDILLDRGAWAEKLS